METRAHAAGVLDDFALMQQIARGSEAALAELYDRTSGTLFAICVRILRDPSDAEEVLSDVYAELWRRSDRYQIERGAPRAYLVKLTRSRAIDKLRSRQRGQELMSDLPLDWTDAAGEGTSETADPLTKRLDEERIDLIRQALDQLSAVQRRAIELSFIQGLSHSEVARETGEPLGTVKTRIRQGLLNLRDALRPIYGGGARS